MLLEEVLLVIYSAVPLLRPEHFFSLFLVLSGFTGGAQTPAFILSFCLTSGHLKVNNEKGRVESVFG